MEPAFKLLLFLLINLTALGYLLFEFIELGNSYPQALRLAWDGIMLNGFGGCAPDVSNPRKWVSLLRKTWWLMIFLHGLFWITSRQSDSTILVLVLLLLHGYWWIHSTIGSVKADDQVFFANENWGIIYTTINKDSRWEQKSLAELDLRKKNLLILAVEHEGQLSAFPKGSEILLPDDRVLLFGELSSYREVNR